MPRGPATPDSASTQRIPYAASCHSPSEHPPHRTSVLCVESIIILEEETLDGGETLGLDGYRSGGHGAFALAPTLSPRRHFVPTPNEQL